jgi:FMN hydrolase / 5-amino-6-(5-phospho-D-ribitylamino)uracil phosphatase
MPARTFGHGEIRCITFDLDDTLWATGPVIDRAEQIAHTWLEKNAPAALAGRSSEELLLHRREHYATLPHYSHDFTALRRDWLETLVTAAGYERELGQRAFEVFWIARNEVEPFEDALCLLRKLQTSFTLGSITNGNADVAHIGLDALFRFSVTAADAGVMKPHPQIFSHALGLGGIQPSAAVHVGDDPVTDVQGAKAAGMLSVWVNPDNQPWDPAHGPGPDATIARTAQLWTVLEQWGAV